MGLMLFLYSTLFFLFYGLLGWGVFYLFFDGGLVFEWYFLEFCGVDLGFSIVLDYVSMGFFSCVSFISFIVFIYRMFYISGTVDMRRFGWLVFLFVVSIFLLVFSGNFFFV